MHKLGCIKNYADTSMVMYGEVMAEEVGVDDKLKI